MTKKSPERSLLPRSIIFALGMITFAVFVGAAVVARNGLDWALGQLTESQWEAWRNWLATIGGLVALIVATRTYFYNSRTKREEQPRMVYSTLRELEPFKATETFPRLGARASHDVLVSGATPVPGSKRDLIATEPVLRATVAIVNRSKEVIGPAQVDLFERETGKTIATSPAFMTIDPDSEKRISFIYIDPDPDGLVPVGSIVVFRDSGGRTWRRRASDPIDRVKN